MSSSELTFNQTETFQEAIIGHAILDSDFFRTATIKIQPEWFTANARLGTLFKQLQGAIKYYGEPITTPQELKEVTFFRELTPNERELYYILIDRCVHSAKEFFSINKVRKELTGFLRTAIFKESIQGAAKMYKDRGYSNAYEWTKAKLSEIAEATFENDNMVNKLGDVVNWLERQNDDGKIVMSTGNSLLDEALGGGLFRQDNSAILAPSNVGKSRTMITIARHAVRQRKKVLFLTHEDVPDKIKERILMSFLGINRKTLHGEWMKDDSKIKIIQAAAAMIDKYLFFLPFNKAGQMYVEDVIDTARNLHKDLEMREGSGFDIIIDDYPKKLRMKSPSGGKEGLYRAELAQIYDYFVQLAIELNCHCMVAVQTNREGLKMNNMRRDDGRMIGMEDVDESFGIIQNLGNVISIMRTPDDKVSNVIRFNIAKNRDGATDVVVVSRSSYSTCTVFGDHAMLSSTWNMDIPKNYLASFKQEGASLMETSALDEQLKKLEEVYYPNKEASVGGYQEGTNGKLQ